MVTKIPTIVQIAQTKGDADDAGAAGHYERVLPSTRKTIVVSSRLQQAYSSETSSANCVNI